MTAPLLPLQLPAAAIRSVPGPRPSSSVGKEAGAGGKWPVLGDRGWWQELSDPWLSHLRKGQLSGRREDGAGQRQQRASCSARRSAKAPALLPLKPSAFSPRACGQQHPKSPRGGNEVTQGQAPGGNSGGNSVASAAIRITMQSRSPTSGRRGPGTRRKRLAPKAALSAALPEPLRTLLRS